MKKLGNIWTFAAVVAIFGIVGALIACENGNGNGDPVLCDCSNGTVYYDTECPCGGNNCNCKSEYKPEFSDIFEMNEGSLRLQTIQTYTDIWQGSEDDKRLILRLRDIVEIRGDKIYVSDSGGAGKIQYRNLSGYLIIAIEGNVDDSQFTNLFKAALQDCIDDNADIE